MREGYTIIPLRIVLRNGIAKMDIAIAKGKKLYDGTLSNLRKNYDYLRKITVTTNDKILLNEEYIIEEKIKDGKIEFTIDIRKMSENATCIC